MTARPNVLIHVQHLLGTGHIVRAAAIGRVLAALGCRVLLVHGNTIPPTLDTSGLETLALPPLRARDVTFSTLVDAEGSAINESFKHRRRDMLLNALATWQPDIVLTETYPFGRRQLSFELTPLVEAVRAMMPRPLLVSSVRDILVRKDDPRKEAAMADLARRWFDLVLVHADPDMVRLEDSFPYVVRIAPLIAYTGFVHLPKPTEPPDKDGVDEVVVSCGGGIVGERLLRCALAARAFSRKTGDTTWRLLVGHDVGEADFTALSAAPPPGVIVERARPDFPGLLARARLSVSQAGYNTVLDLLAARVPCVLVPFAQAGENEQTTRATALARSGRAIHLEEESLTPEALAQGCDAALSLPRSEQGGDMNGAETSARILLREWEMRR